MSEDYQASEEEQEYLEEDLYEHYRFVVEKGQEIKRIDKYLIDRIPNTSRNKIQNATKDGNILVNEQKVKQNYKIKPEDIISIVLPYPVRNLELISENIPLDIHYEDDTLMVVNKPPNMVVHPGYGNYTGTLLNGLLYHVENLPSNPKDYNGRPGLVHRLDKHTTGLLVVAKTEEALNHLAKQFFDRKTERRYQALVWGEVKDDEGTIVGNIGRSLKDRKMFVVYPDGDHGKPAVTHYKVIKRLGYVTLVECRLETGRTHQIRVHMKSIGHTLFNDIEYGGNKVLKGTTFSKYKMFVQNCFSLLTGQALHAKTLGFIHPKTGEKMQFTSDLPEAFQEVIHKWERYVISR